MNWDELFSRQVAYEPESGGKLPLPGSGGVYLLTDEQDRLVQLASAADLKRAVTHRLTPRPTTGDGRPVHETESAEPDGQQEGLQMAAGGTGKPAQADTGPVSPPAGPASRRRADLSQIVRRIRWQPAHSAFEIAWEYLRVARVVLPDTYLKTLAFGPAWFVHVDPAAEIPRFTVSRVVPRSPCGTLGPFAAQQDANRFVQILEDAFDLCRYIHILEQAPHGQPCAYYEMGRCPGPCGGLIPMSEYRRTVEQAATFAAGRRAGTYAELESRMREASGGLEFEKAAALKQRLERAREVEHAAFRLARPIEQFNWLIVQRGGGRTRMRPFFVRGGRLDVGEIVRLKDLDSQVPAWLEHVRTIAAEPAFPKEGSEQRSSEHIWLVSHFLFRRERPGLFLDAGCLPEAGELSERVRAEFAKSRENAPPS